MFKILKNWKLDQSGLKSTFFNLKCNRSNLIVILYKRKQLHQNRVDA